MLVNENRKTAIQRAWQLLEESVVTYRGQPVGTVAAHDPETEALNYDQVFTRDFAISAFAFLLDGRPEIVRHFLATAVRLQSHERQLDCFKPGEGLIPVSFKDTGEDADEQLTGDFPALEGQDWRLLTGCDPKNRPWSYHNGGNWPVLLWLLALVGLRTGADELVERTLSDAEQRLLQDDWPEYYDGRRGRMVGQQARRHQT
jgi:glycogen debranching enzyme